MRRNLIDMDTLTEMIKRICCHAEDETDLLDALKEMPTIDAVEVVHGKWIEADDLEGAIKGRVFCSNCKNPFESIVMTNEKIILTNQKTKYCPNCGAKMDGGEE